MVVYILLIAAIILMCLLDIKIKMSQNVKNWLFFGCAVLIFILSAFRDPVVGVDSEQYCDFYKNINNRSSIFLTEFEIGFSLLVRTLHSICRDPQFLLIVSSFIIIGSFTYFVKTNL